MSNRSSPLTPHQALIYVMVTISAVDRQMTDEEMKRIGDIVGQSPIFADFDPDELVKTAEACGAILRQDNGLDTVLKLVAAVLPQRLHETAYALAVEVAAADLAVSQEEIRFLELLRDALDLDKLTTAAIERGARARHATL